jgi:hypothetical protein
MDHVGDFSAGKIKASDYPKESRPCCVVCRRPMLPDAGRGDALRWRCQRDKLATMAHFEGRSYQTKQIGTRYPAEMRPFCWPCRRRMTLSGPAADRVWQCRACYVSAKMRRSHEDRGVAWPWCIVCRRRMTRPFKGVNLTYRCEKCDTNIKGRRRPAMLEAEFPIGERAMCIACRRPMGVGGVPGHRRWNCAGCGANCLHVGKGNKKKPKLYIVPKVAAQYLDKLIDLSDQLVTIIREHQGEVFNVNLSTLNKAIRYFARNDENENREAVRKEVEAGCCTPEEIAETVPLPIEHIQALCHQLVKQSRVYEWRPVGYDAKHGARIYGIFRRDAPTLVREGPDDPYKYSGHHEQVAALTDLREHIRQREATAGAKPLPWESPSDAALRVARQRQAAQSTSAFSFLMHQRMKAPN